MQHNTVIKWLRKLQFKNSSTLLIVGSMAVTILLAACSNGSTVAGGESGIGGTGISFVKGNVASTNRSTATSDKHHNTIIRLALNTLISNAYAQTGSLSGIGVAGGGTTAVTDDRGDFILANVESSNQFIITFTFQNGASVKLNIGAVSEQTIVNVNNIEIDTTTGRASFESINRQDNSSPENSTQANQPSTTQQPEEETEPEVPTPPSSGDDTPPEDSGDNGSVGNDGNDSPL